MGETGLQVIDRSVHELNEWLKEINAEMGGDRQYAYHVLRGVMFGLRDRLPTDEAIHLSAQLPLIVRGIYWESYHAGDKPETARTRNQFLDQVSQHFKTAEPVDTERAVRTVFAILEGHIDGNEVEKVRHLLPVEVQELTRKAA